MIKIKNIIQSNREKKQIAIIISILVIYILIGIVVVIPTEAVSYKNGTSWARTPQDYLRDYYGERNYYGTHDWIAEKAWDLTVADPSDPWLTAGGLLFDSPEIRATFLLGTEVPDYNEGLMRATPLWVDTKCGLVPVSAILGGLGCDHKYEFDSDGETHGRSAYHSGSRAFSMALFHLAMGHCQAAAYYLGAMTHYISDVTSFPHTLYKAYVWHKTFEWVVENNIDTFPSNLHGFNKLSIYASTPPPLCIVGAATDTFFGEGDEARTHGSEWLAERFFSNNIDGGINNPEHQEYWNIIRRNVNNAIYWCANALNFFHIVFGNDIDCNCRGFNLHTIGFLAVDQAMGMVVERVSLLAGFVAAGPVVSVVTRAEIEGGNPFKNK